MYQELDPSRGPLSRDEKAFLGLFLLIFMGFFITEIVTDYSPRKLGIVLFMLFWMPLVALHELGHALVAWAVGWHVGEIVVGQGRPVTSFRLGSAHVELRILPFTGFVRFVPTDLRWPRMKLASIYLAGPGIELAIAVAITFAVGFDTMFTESNDYGIIALQTLALAATTGAVLNLIPNGARTPEGFLPNDGLGFLRTWWMPDAAFEGMRGWEYRPSQRRWDRPYEG